MRRNYFDADHEAFRATFRAFLEREVVPYQREWEEAGRVDREVWRKAGKQGFLLPWADPRHGGLGLADFRYEQVIIEELAAIHDSGLAIPLHSAIVAPYLAHFGTAEQQDRYLPGAVSGDIVLALAITEPGTGSDVAGIRTRAVDAGDHWVLTGQKTFISNGLLADLVIVAARTDPNQRHAIGLFLVEAGTPGFTRGRKLDKLGLRAQDTAELFFDEVRIPKENALGDPKAGFAAIMWMFAQERLVVAISSVAAAQVALRDTVEYVTQRQAFGRALADFQDTRFRLAAMRTEVDVAQAFVDRCVLAHNDGELTPVAAAEAKLFASEMLGRVVDDCLQMHGGYGYMWEYPICRAYADARVQRIYAGTSEIMKEIISRAMLGEHRGGAA
ncbi:acyl-CoA dehydrogenase [Carbonactinospora thermoautotrophica]|uniref:Acyl-[acyl-carrier-protein] dehydrogenase MbtN n=1 Tax=Carbonactinospora thermoautotrophica TaxID=1469144 RepID=A0A132MV79_9ACTN|nr:acyl-CoA dehydrogenase family protein [Carbonactinospora thermoautotrophica]KWX00190.1 acyl-CoA dehydrogenase [Carbonactinospora thermoautotrophica]KWX01805.1 Butyryl-CoA dehydrogenase [Carbonactinospora thermoautotrophica]KWX09873.1 acyl-CoA dehydrogenase [Carbonactinospora thermoautotrophica]MCX9190947.1 acyl-CoA dehydrogenase [Carbonactinospora thermoautotrophica]